MTAADITLNLTRSSVLTFFPLYVIVVHENKYTPETGETKTLSPELKWFPSLFKTSLNLTTEFLLSVISAAVQKNDHVWIQTSGHYSENYFEYDHSSGSSFMGFLMYVT
jgi:hypothetical protein